MDFAENVRYALADIDDPAKAMLAGAALLLNCSVPELASKQYAEISVQSGASGTSGT